MMQDDNQVADLTQIDIKKTAEEEEKSLDWESVLEQKQADLAELLVLAASESADNLIFLQQADGDSEGAEADDTGMSDKELKKWMEKIGLNEGFEKLETEYVLPMNIEEVWAIFFADDAKYNFDNAMVDLGDILESIGKWKNYEKLHDEERVLKHRVITSIDKLPSNPLSTTVENTRNSYLLQKSDTELVVEDMNTGAGFKYADTALTRIRWEIYQPTASSQKSVLRVSWKF